MGEISVIVSGGPVKNQGEHWFPDGTSLATVLDWAGVDSFGLPRNVYVVDTEGHEIRCRVLHRPKKELEQVKMSHGTRVVVPWDRCF